MELLVAIKNPIVALGRYAVNFVQDLGRICLAGADCFGLGYARGRLRHDRVYHDTKPDRPVWPWRNYAAHDSGCMV